MENSGAVKVCSDSKAEYPYYTEESFERKLRRNWKRQAILHEQIVEVTDWGYLKRVEFDTAMERARLTAKQSRVFQEYVQGYSLDEIGQRLGISKQAVAKTLRFALKKVRVAWQTNPYKGLAEVYYEETRRCCTRIGRRVWR